MSVTYEGNCANTFCVVYYNLPLSNEELCNILKIPTMYLEDACFCPVEYIGGKKIRGHDLKNFIKLLETHQQSKILNKMLDHWKNLADKYSSIIDYVNKN